MKNEQVSTTQEHLDIYDIKDDLVILKSKVVCAVLKTNALNFSLLSEIEQDAIIAAFSMLLNSINFPMQVVIRSQRLDITKYIEKVKRVESKVKDPLLKKQAESYRGFIQDVIRTNEVLDKQFYVVIPSGSAILADKNSSAFDWVSKLLGTHNKRYSFSTEKVLNEARLVLSPRVEHVIKEFSRIGIKTKQLTTQELVELYFDIYNPTNLTGQRVRTNIEDYKTAIVNPAIIEE